MILNYLAKSKRVLECINDKVKRVSKSNQNFNMYTIASDYQKNNRMIFVVLPTLFDAQTYYDGLLNLVCEDDVLFYPVDEMVTASLLIASNEFKLTGFIDAGGTYRDTEFYKAFKNGGLFFLDEIDNSDPYSFLLP